MCTAAVTFVLAGCALLLYRQFKHLSAAEMRCLDLKFEIARLDLLEICAHEGLERSSSHKMMSFSTIDVRCGERSVSCLDLFKSGGWRLRCAVVADGTDGSKQHTTTTDQNNLQDHCLVINYPAVTLPHSVHQQRGLRVSSSRPSMYTYGANNVRGIIRRNNDNEYGCNKVF